MCAAAAAVPAVVVVIAHLAYVWQLHPASADRQSAAFAHGVGLAAILAAVLAAGRVAHWLDGESAHVWPGVIGITATIAVLAHLADDWSAGSAAVRNVRILVDTPPCWRRSRSRPGSPAGWRRPRGPPRGVNPRPIRPAYNLPHDGVRPTGGARRDGSGGGGRSAVALGRANVTDRTDHHHPPAWGCRSPVNVSSTSSGLNAAEIYRRDAAGVVVVTATTVRRVGSPLDPFAPRQKERARALGSGFVIDRRAELTMRDEIVASRSCGSRAQSAVMPSRLSTARIATVYWYVRSSPITPTLCTGSSTANDCQRRRYHPALRISSATMASARRSKSSRSA